MFLGFVIQFTNRKTKLPLNLLNLLNLVATSVMLFPYPKKIATGFLWQINEIKE